MSQNTATISSPHKPAYSAFSLWFDDGNVVFIAQKVAFRVHKSVMARNSDVFIGLFAIPQPSSCEETDLFEGVPSVEVQDTSYDFGKLIHALYGEIG